MEAAPPAPAPDRAPDELAAGIAQPLRGELEELLGADRVLGRPGDLVSYASDASPYRHLPRAVVRPHDAEEVGRVLAFGRRRGIPVTFRAAGTSLNGQSQGSGILVDVSRHFRGTVVLGEGERVRLRPGTILGHANRVLAPFGTKLGPDPASADVCTVGGVIANNSGGMRCGVAADSYATVRELTFVLPSGTTIDTGAAGAEERFAAAEPELVAGLEAIRDEIHSDPELSARIRRKFEIKNTTGYRLCAFLDAERPLEIFRRLLVGSEGTLAFVAEAELATVPVPAATAAAWVHFPDVDAAVAPVNELVAAGATAVELMGADALMTASSSMIGAPPEWTDLPPESAALLVELAGAEGELDAKVARAEAILAAHETIRPVGFARDPEQVALAWRVRGGLHGLIGKTRPEGTAMIVEDVCVPPPRIGECAHDLQELLGEHGFLTAVAGHASAGNLHCWLTPDFGVPGDVDRYEAFMAGLVDLVVGKYDGSLKAEHGTGLNMAPYVEREWGERATALMWRVKELADPEGVLSPGVLLSREEGAHLRNLKVWPRIEEAATHCVECGFCEPVCPSRDLTRTPRERIVLRREMARQPVGSPVWRALEKEYEYDGLATCATDGSCQLACPIGIDTGALVKQLRAAGHPPGAERMELATAGRWNLVEGAARAGLRFGGPLARRTRRGGALPKAAPSELPATIHAGAAAVYLPSCTNRILAGSPAAALVAVSARAGLPVWIPPDLEGSCCGLPWSSKGFEQAHRLKANEMVERLWGWSGEGALPVVIDAASCTSAVAEPGPGVLGTENSERLAALRILDSVAWAHDHLLPWLEVGTKVGSATVHPTCATRRMGLAPTLSRLAAALADDVYVAPSAHCCGFAGDRGVSHPELTEAATRPQAQELAAAEREGGPFDARLSSNRTCEIGLERATGEPYESIVILLERLTRA